MLGWSQGGRGGEREEGTAVRVQMVDGQRWGEGGLERWGRRGSGAVGGWCRQAEKYGAVGRVCAGVRDRM